jgi:ribonuclease P protein component
VRERINPAPNAGDYYEKNIPAQRYLEKEKTWIQGKDGNQRRKKSSERQKKKRAQTPGAIVLNRRCLKRIRKSWHFRKIFKKGKYFRGSVIRARYIKNSLGRIRLGFSVSAKTGNAAKRNLFKRRLRQYSVEKTVVSGYDAVIFPLVPLESTDWKGIREDMERLTAEAAEPGE